MPSGNQNADARSRLPAQASEPGFGTAVGNGRGRAMLKPRILLTALAGSILAAGLSASIREAAAQFCDDRYPQGCQGFSSPPARAPQAMTPYGAQPQMTAPYYGAQPQVTAPYYGAQPPVTAPYGAQPQVIAPYGVEGPEPIAPVAPQNLARPTDPATLDRFASHYAGVAG